MKKFTLFFAAIFAVVLCVNALELNNPKDADGFYIVKWDCANNTWAAANDIEVDETFTFAVDITGTALADWLKETPAAEGATRSIAINKWSNKGEINGATNRLKQISGNIYGATWNIAQMGAAGTTMTIGELTMTDSICYVGGQVFGFEYTADNAGAGWWMWPTGIPEGEAVDPGTGNIFKTLPYTGTKTSGEFYNDDYPGFFDFDESLAAQAGYAFACAVDDETGIEEIFVPSSPIVSYEYFDLLGSRLATQPTKGICIVKAIKADGTWESRKVFFNE